MKKSNMMAAILVMVISAATFANAQEIKIDFDGRASRGSGFAESIKAIQTYQGSVPQSGQTDPLPEKVEAAGVPVQKDIKISVILRNSGKIFEETLLCRPGPDGKTAAACTKQSDALTVTPADVDAMALREFFPAPMAKKLETDLLNLNKHSYTNQSGPQTFSCEDACGNWVTEKVEVGWDNGPIFSMTEVCKSWTHSCECVAGCY